MTNEKAIKHLEVIKGDCALVGDVRALDMAISALSTEGEYIKKDDAISKILTEFVSREENGKVVCACADVKQTCADILDSLPTYSFPDSADDNTMDIYSDLLRVKHGTMSIDSLIDKVWCGRKAVNK